MLKTKDYIKKGQVGKRVLKWALVVLLIAPCVFLFMEYLSWGTWTWDQCKIPTCTEQIYRFEDGGWFDSGIYTDEHLIESCEAGVDAIQLWHAHNLQQAIHVGANVSLPYIQTKCGIVTPSYISLKTNTTERGQNKTAGLIVPNIVHYGSFGSWEFSFLNYLSYKSVDRYINPECIYIHGDILPHGYWWNRTVHEIGNLYYVYREPSERIQGRKIPWVDHKAVIVALQTLLDNGGIYLDRDVLVLKSFDDLRKYPVTLGRETSNGLGSGVMVAAPSAAFICVWLHGFRTYNPWPWNRAAHISRTPHNLANVMQDSVHIEEDSLRRPSLEETKLLFKGRINWEDIYAMHIWKGYGFTPKTADEILTLNSTLGEVMRYVYFGSPEVRDEL